MNRPPDINALSDTVPGGFIISARRLSHLTNWQEFAFGHLHVYLGNFNKRSHRMLGSDILLLGEVYYSPLFSVSTALQELKQRLDKSLDEFLAAVKSLSGRFALLFRSGDDYYILNDAGAFMPVFYSTLECLVASHDVLIPCASSQAYEPTYASLKTRWGFPGDLSRFDNVLTLVANHWLCLESHELERISLNGEDRIDTNISDLSEQVVQHIRSTLSGASADAQLYMGLTGGFDSRLTLAAAIDMKDRITFFTYDEGSQGSARDIRLATRLSKAFGLKHSVLKLKYRREPDFRSYLHKFRLRNLYRHNAELPYAYARYFQDRNGVLIRSNYYEAIRADIQRRAARRRVSMNEPSGVAQFYEHSANEGRVRDMIRKTFADYFQRNRTIDACAHFDAWDVFFSEHRMTAWMGQVISGTDYAFTTCVPINSHDLVRRIYSLDVSDRIERQVFARSFDKYLPKARDIPFH